MQIPSCPQKGFYRFCYCNASLKALVEEERAQSIWGNGHRLSRVAVIGSLPAGCVAESTYFSWLLAYLLLPA
jgi:hypothetical protein